MTVSSSISRVNQLARSAIWRPIARVWAIVILMVATVSAGPALAVTKTVNGISLDINMPQAQRGVQYSFQLAPSGKTAPYTFQILSGALPAAFTMSSSGLVTGVNCVSTNGSYNVAVRVTSADSTSADFTSNQSVSINMTAGPASGCALTGGAISSGGSTPQVGQYYSATISASGGSSPYTYSVATGSLPTGLSLSSSGTLSGTPSAAGSFDFQIQSADSAGNTGYTQYTLVVSAASSVVVSPSSLPTPILNTAYSQTISGSGGTSPYTFAVSSGSLPTGLSLNASTGVISGTPTAAGAYSFTIRATDAGSQSNTRSYSGAIAATLAVTPSTLTTPILNQAYSQTVASTGGTAPVTFAVSAGVLPTGLSLNASTGAITGTPTAAGAYGFTLQATDANSVTATQAYSGAIASSLAITSGTLPTPVLNTAYSQTIATSGGAAPVTFAVSAGSLPTGLSLNNSTGAIAGAPTAAGAYGFTIEATDANSVTATQAYSGAIATTLAITTTILPTPVLNTAYSQAVSTSGGIAPVTFAVSAGSLPAGLSLNSSTGAITGAPTAAGAYSFTIQVTDNNSVTATHAYSGAISSGLAITTTTLPTPVLSAAYSQTVSTSGGTAPVTFAVSAGNLPAGLSLNSSTGAITGTPTAAGAYSFTVLATDHNNVKATQAYSGAIVAGLTVAGSLGSATVGQPYAGSVGAAGGLAPYSFSAGGLPPGLGIDAGGAITGTPTTSGSYSVTVVVTDANGSSATQALTIVVGLAVTASDQSVDVPYNTATTITLATLNAGDALELQSNPVNGTLSQVGPIVEYMPNAGYIGADGFGFAIKGAWGQSRTASVKLNVLPPPPPTAEPPPTTTLDTTGPAGGTSGAGGSGASGDAAVVVDKVNFNLASLVKGIVTDVQIAAHPRHGKVELVRASKLAAARMTAEQLCAAAAPAAPEVIAVYTADKGYVGRDSFTFVAIGPGGVSAPATVNIEVIKSTPTAPVLKVKATGGRKVTVDLTAAATDGPFLAAALVTSPAAAIGTARLIEGGLATARTYQLEFTSKGAFTGDITFTYTLTNSSGVSDPLTLILTIEARQDPTTDASVRAVNDAQTEAARRFAGAQLDNFGRRLESLHGGQTGDGFGLNVASGVGQADACRLRAHTPEEERVCREQAATVSAKAGEVPAQRPMGKIEVWTGGAITVGRRDADTRLAKLTVQTSGISGGADVRLSPAVTVGVGGGYASDVTKLSDGKGRIDADGWTAATYASVHPASGVFVDAVAGVGQMTFDTRRTTAASNERVTGQRDASLRFGSLTAGYDGAARHAVWSLYLRAKALDAKLNAYAERGSDTYALAYDRRQLSSLVGVIGGRVQFDREVGEVRVTPRVRVEYSHEFAAVDPQRIRYADWLDGASYELVGDAWATDRMTLGVGSGLGFDNGWSLDFDLGAELAKRQSSATARVGAAKRF